MNSPVRAHNTRTLGRVVRLLSGVNAIRKTRRSLSASSPDLPTELDPILQCVLQQVNWLPEAATPLNPYHLIERAVRNISTISGKGAATSMAVLRLVILPI